MTNTTPIHFSSIIEGEFGRVEVLEFSHDLVMQAHPQTHFGFWLGGGAAMTQAGGQLVRFDEDTVFAANSHESHDLKLLHPQQPALFLMLYVNDEWLDGLHHHLGCPVVLSQPQIVFTPTIRQACAGLLQLIADSASADADSLASGVRHLVQQTIANNISALPRSGVMRRRKLIDYRLRVAIAHMHAQLGQPVVAERVAEVVGLSRSRFFELFHDQLKTSPQVYWNSIRVEEAVKRLMMKKESMTHLSMDLGFSTPGNFSRFFRDHKGMTPSRYCKLSHAVSPSQVHSSTAH
jgi:AraC-like DNA-binding protein